ncbi:hypothetical protein PJN16_10055 [Mycobacterium kansasii]
MSATYLASVVTSTGSIETYSRQGNRAHFVIFGRDAVSVRTSKQPWVAQWCASERGARTALPEWQRYGGEWMILPVAYTTQPQR